MHSAAECTADSFYTNHHGMKKNVGLTLLRCGAGEYAPSSTPNSCKDCPAGKHNGDIGINLGLENTCTDCQDDEVSVAGSKECSVCPEGKFRRDNAASNAAPTCALCPAGQFGNTAGAVNKCSECQESQISPKGSESETDCFFKYQAYKGVDKKNKEIKYCTGLGDDSNKSPLARIPDAAGCEVYATEKKFNFTLASQGIQPECTNDFTDADGCGPADVDCSKSKDKKNCPVTCNNCGSEAATAAGCVQVNDPKTNDITVYFFNAADTSDPWTWKFGVEPITFTPVCEAFFCSDNTDTLAAVLGADMTVRKENRDNWATKESGKPKCTVSDEGILKLQAEEDGKFKVFLYVAAPAALVAQVVSYGVARARWEKDSVCELPFRAHWWVTMGATGKLVDLMTDFGSFFINYGMIGDTSNQFYKRYEEQDGNSADTVRTIALVSLILGTLCFIPDVHYGLVLKSGRGGLAGAKLWSALSFLLEDAPQIAVSLVFAFAIRITELSWDDENKIMLVVSLALSAITVLDRLFIIFCKCGSSEASYAI